MYQELALVSSGHEVIVPDLAGFGASRDLTAHGELSGHGQDVADLVEELGLSDVIIVGFAFGAAVALAMPDHGRVAGIVAIGTPSAAGAPYDRMRSSMLRDWPRFAGRSATAICAQPQSEESLAWLARIFATTPLHSAVSGVDILARYEPLDRPSGLPVPSLFVHGADDPIVSPDVSRACAERFGGKVEIVPDSGHFVPWDQAAAVTEAIEAFERSLA
ncbi:alpha/beta hydrolase [Streptomyces muensis]|uniref:Alpha/beta hydrolase n=2 Tax=Streptomyces muensis TaxID=1077944 RepID=A0A9X1PWD4_STRM4|nr:alpha/beta hydrolase [Streptomyces muensis]